MKLGRILAAASAIVVLASSMALATPSTQIWIPSTDAKDFKAFHIDIDNYTRLSGKTGNGLNPNLSVSLPGSATKDMPCSTTSLWR